MQALQVLLEATGIDLTPRHYRETGVFTLMCEALPGDHIAVRTVTDGALDITWHHGIYLGQYRVAHMHPDGNISAVSFDTFVRDIVGVDTYVDTAVIIDYDKDSSLAKELTVKVAEWAMADPGMQHIAYNAVAANCECFASFCRTGRCDNAGTTALHQVMQIVTDLVPPKQHVTMRKPLCLSGGSRNRSVASDMP